jgi:ribonuclease P/MRP protein subunit POP5
MKRRYLALEIESAEMFDSKRFMDSVWGAVTKLYGEYGASQTGLTLIDYDAEKRFAVIRAANSAVDMVRAALASMTRIENNPLAVHVLKASGTIKALYKNLK